ncbi:MAG TPA: thioesterase family protein [Prochlorococcaceae cyanobacterium AMR_MDS_5431]|nr:thioesterase family protein [Prochlorococcaceae cyanobacterium AMR_MDS_5431]
MQITTKNIKERFVVKRTVRFGDTDAAGVMHFHKILPWCHEAYEESLEHFGIQSTQVFPQPTTVNDNNSNWPSVLLPIIHCSVDYRVPLVCGDNIIIELNSKIVSFDSFEVYYDIACKKRTVVQAKTRHLAIQAINRQRCNLPTFIHDWIDILTNDRHLV